MPADQNPTPGSTPYLPGDPPPAGAETVSAPAGGPALPATQPAGTLPETPSVVAARFGTPATRPTQPGPLSTLTGTALPQIPGYLVECEIARGGMGVVYRARHLQLNRPAAIKMILGGRYHDPTAQMRFLIEAEAVAALDHPHIVHVHEFGTHDDQPFFALEFVAGGTLGQKLKRDGKPAVPTAAELLVKLADAMAAAHAKGIVHRDLKPGNILLTESGEPKVTDFGLAKVGASDVTAVGAVMGTPSYMPPEQAAGRTREIGTHSDTYSLGAILYEALTGKPPFLGESSAATIQQVLNAESPRPRAIDPNIPRDLETICLKCLEKDYQKRYATAAELAADLRAYLDGRPISARPVGTLERAWKWARRNKALTAGGALGVIAIGAAVAAVVASADARTAAERANVEATLRAAAEAATEQAQQARATAEELRTRAETGERRARTAEVNIRRLKYGADVSLAEQAMRERNGDQLRQRLAEAALAVGGEDLRGFEWFHLRRFDHRPLAALRGHEERITALAFAPSGGRLVSACVDGKLAVWAPGTTTPERYLEGHDGKVTSIAFSPNGKWLATAGIDGRALVWATDDWACRHKFTVGGKNRLSLGVVLAFSPDGLQLAAGSAPGQEVGIWNTISWKPIKTVDTGPVTVLAFTPDNEGLVFGGPPGSATRIWDLEKDKARLTLATDPIVQVTAVAAAPDGGAIATAGEGAVRVWDAGTGILRWPLVGHSGKSTAVAFNRAGDLLASVATDGTARIWSPSEGTELAVLRADATEAAHVVAFNSDGSRLAVGYGDNIVRIWPVTARQETFSLRAGKEDVTGFAADARGRCGVTLGTRDGAQVWDLVAGRRTHALAGHRPAAATVSADGKLVATADTDGDLRVWDAGAGKVVQTVKGAHPGGAQCVAFSPDGKQLVSGGADRGVRIWGVADGRMVRNCDGHTDTVLAVAFSADGTRVASGGVDRTARVWSVADGAEVGRVSHGDRVAAVAFGPTGEVMSAGWDRTAVIWAPGTDRRVQLKGHTSEVFGAVFTPDGRRAITAGADATLRLWDAGTGQELITLRGHRGPIRGLAVRADGRRVLSAGDDATIKAWDSPAEGPAGNP